MIALLCVAFGLRIPLLNGPRFHPDEALFASFARSIAVWRDPLLATAPVDKPPLLFYLQALCYPFLGPKEMAARLPNLFASLLTVALTYAVAAKLFHLSSQHSPLRTSKLAPPPHLAPLLAALFVSLSPLAIAYGSTAFTDSLMVMWGLASMLAALRANAGRAGLFLGLGLATKYQAIVFLPLVVAFLSTSQPNHRWSRWIRLVGGLLAPVAMVLLWELARTGKLSIIRQQLEGYGTIRLAETDRLIPRLRAWSELGRYALGSAWLELLLVAAVPLVLIFRRLRPRPTLPWIVLMGWLSGYLLLHWLVNVNTWDRYLLPIVPVSSIVAGWLIGQLAPAQIPLAAFVLLALILLIPLFPVALQAAGGALPLGGDHGTFDGIEQVARFMAEFPYGTVLYDHWLSWELRYYLFDSRVYVSWFPDAAALTTDLRAFACKEPGAGCQEYPSRLLITPTWESTDSMIQDAQADHFTFTPVFYATRPDQTVSFIIYQIGYQTP